MTVKKHTKIYKIECNRTEKIESSNAQYPLRKLFHYNTRGLKNYKLSWWNNFIHQLIDTKTAVSVSYSTGANQTNI